MCKKAKSGGFGVAQKLLRLMGALERPWPLGKKQNYVNICKTEKSGASAVAQKLLGLKKALDGPWPLGRLQNWVNMCVWK